MGIQETIKKLREKDEPEVKEEPQPQPQEGIAASDEEKQALIEKSRQELGALDEKVEKNVERLREVANS